MIALSSRSGPVRLLATITLIAFLSACRVPFLPNRYEEEDPAATFSTEYDPVESFLGAVVIGDEEQVERGLHPDSPRRQDTLATIQSDFPADRVYQVHKREVSRYANLDAYNDRYDGALPEEVFYFEIRTVTYGNRPSFNVARVYDWSTEEPQ